MNVTFVTGDAALDAKFVKEAAAQGLVNLKGHRIVGGMRGQHLQRHARRGRAKARRFYEAI